MLEVPPTWAPSLSGCLSGSVRLCLAMELVSQLLYSSVSLTCWRQRIIEPRLCQAVCQALSDSIWPWSWFVACVSPSSSCASSWASPRCLGVVPSLGCSSLTVGFGAFVGPLPLSGCQSGFVWPFLALEFAWGLRLSVFFLSLLLGVSELSWSRPLFGCSFGRVC